MLAFNATFLDDRRMCATGCGPSSVVVYDYPTCAGLCKPVERLRELAADAACGGGGGGGGGGGEGEGGGGGLPRVKGYFTFAPPKRRPD